ncbi:DUF221-domain-containing protein [Lichtheimia hyalospora FSU 10163]|nr:DUF221-domain-containing protein [Lichtheimia hyalospora FSU 10163]
MNVYTPFQEQISTDATLTLKSMGTQMGISLGVSLAVIAGFSFLRPRHTLVYAPKYKFSSPEQRPPEIGTGWFAWFKPVLKADDDFLMERIGFDAVLFLRFIRLLRRLLIAMSVIGVCALIPVNIVATYHTGDWPPAAGLDLLSISGINYSDDDARNDIRWYWSPTVATWVFSILIGWFMFRASCDYIDMRQRYFRHPPNALSARTLLVTNIPENKRSDDGIKHWMNGMGLKYPVEQAMIGYHSQKLTKLTQEHEEAVRLLENSLSSYLSDGKAVGNKKRPTMRTGGFLFCGGKKVDAIDYYTDHVKDLESQIKKLRANSSAKVANYGWASFKQIPHAHAVDQSLMHQKAFSIRLSPPPSDLIWPNLPLDDKTRTVRRWIGRAIFWVFIFLWMIPVGALSATSNIVNLIRMIPNSEEFIDNNAFLMGMIQSYFTPIVMALFFLVLPMLFRFLSKQQGYHTQTTLDRKVFTKLYIFFIINNLLVFTLASIFIGIYGQIRSLILNGTVADDIDLGTYIVQLAKNITNVSTFWINYVCIKALGLTMEMAQVLPLLLITLRKWITRPSPRELRELAQPPPFDYPLAYNMLLFFFTIALLYSAIAPLVLPFALLFFAVSTIVYKYMLMYIFVTKIESGGRMWPVLFQALLTSTVLFQVLMIIILNLKGGHVQSYVLIPLPVLTIGFQYFYYRRMQALGAFLTGTASGTFAPIVIEEEQEKLAPANTEKKSHRKKNKKENKQQDLSNQFQDPAIHKKLLTPMIHDDVKHLLPQVYHHTVQPVENAFEMVGKRMDLKEQHGFHHHQQEQAVQDTERQDRRNTRRLTVLEMDDGAPFKFCAVSEDDALEPEDTDDDDQDDGSSQVEQAHLHNDAREYSDTNSHHASSIDDMDDDEQSQHGLMQHDHMQRLWQQQASLPSIHIPAPEMSSTSLIPSILIDSPRSSIEYHHNIIEPVNSNEEEEELLLQQQRAIILQRRHDSLPIEAVTEKETMDERRGSMPFLKQYGIDIAVHKQEDNDPLPPRPQSMPIIAPLVPETNNAEQQEERPQSMPDLEQYMGIINSTTENQVADDDNNDNESNNEQVLLPSLARRGSEPLIGHRASPPPASLQRHQTLPAKRRSFFEDDLTSYDTQNETSSSIRDSWVETGEETTSSIRNSNRLSSYFYTHYFRPTPGRSSVADSSTNSRYRITYYDDLLNSDSNLPSLSEFGISSHRNNNDREEENHHQHDHYP